MSIYHVAYTIHYSNEDKDVCESLRNEFLKKLNTTFSLYKTLDTTFYIHSAFSTTKMTMREIKKIFDDVCKEKHLCNKCLLEVDLCLIEQQSLRYNSDNQPQHLNNGRISNWPDLDNYRTWQRLYP